MPAPTLGCQIAPHYHTDSDSDDESTLEEEFASQSHGVHAGQSGSSGQEISNEHDAELETPLSIEKAETQRDTGGRPATLGNRRTKSNKSQIPQAPVGFWCWQMAGVRLHVLKLWVRTNFILAVAILAFLCLYWGALFRTEENLHSLGVYIVDFDSKVQPYTNVEPFVGPFITRSIQSLVDRGGHHLGYTFLPPSSFDNDPLRVREAVYDFKAWAAIIINANATSLLTTAIRRGNSSYDPMGAAQIIYNSARDQTTTSSYIIPATTSIQETIMTNFGRAWLAHLLNNNTSPSSLALDTSAQAISPGISFTNIDLRPFGPPIATPAVSVGLIYLIIISFFSFSFFLPIHMKYLSPKGHPPLHFYQLIIWRYVATLGSYFILSCIYSLVSLTYLMPMSSPPGSHVQPEHNANAYGRGTFVVYWMVNWIGMTAFGLASENMAMLLGTPWTALWLIFWVISNVATGFYALPLASRFYRYGYAWPMRNVVEATRQILFDLHPRIGLNIGILLAWVAVDSFLFPLCCYYMRWNTMRVKKNAAEKERLWRERMEKERTDPSFLARVTTLGEGRDGKGWSMRARMWAGGLKKKNGARAGGEV
ncbi:hypothetical protein B0J11DRAFT_62820 [Dendryphion nanum]|uniref:DUF3533 domain-containing protein n=1 Tax=Dendryphion nanum TaxID=256645 RepID=A0A9P9IHZ7_9PLEO|nr:hypothetical protein B0J11DRAFT_62820 [Dendryphion nanum]